MLTQPERTTSHCLFALMQSGETLALSSQRDVSSPALERPTFASVSQACYMLTLCLPVRRSRKTTTFIHPGQCLVLCPPCGGP